jgi:hypothetical protein
MFDIGKENYRSDIKLGEKYRDDQTGIEGVATATSFFQHACERICLEYVVEGKIQETYFDAPRLTHVVTGKIAVSERTGGPAREHDVRGSDYVRGAEGPSPRS